MRTGAPQHDVCSRGHSMAENRKRHPNGDSYCYACKLIRYYNHRKAHPELHRKYSRDSRLRTRYFIEPHAYAELMKSQNQACAICKTSDWGIRGPHVDHDHKTGKTRGLL